MRFYMLKLRLNNFGDIVLLSSQKLEGKLSTIIIYKLFKFHVNLWTFCKKYPDPLKFVL